MILLAIDTAAGLCAACVHDTEAGERGREVRDLGKGHAEHLMAVIDAALARAGIAYGDLDGIGVSIGPGSFTGVRVGVAAARGLALARGVPAVGVSTLEALVQEARENAPGRPVIARIEAGRGQAYVAGYSPDGELAFGPAVLGRDEVAAIMETEGADAILAEGQTADIGVYARLATKKLAAGGTVHAPKPLYLRDADAKPQAAFALPRKEAP